MSGYERPLEGLMYDYDTQRSEDEPGYNSLTQPACTPLAYHGQAHTLHSATYPGHLSHAPINNHYYPARDASAFHPLEHPYTTTDHRLRHFPELLSVTPLVGTYGSPITVHIRSQYDYLAAPQLLFPLMFASKRCLTGVERLSQREGYHYYNLTTEIPPYEELHWADSNNVPLFLQIEDAAGTLCASKGLPSFSYSENHPAMYSRSTEGTRKRKLEDLAENLRSPVKRPSMTTLRTRTRDVSGAYISTPELNSPTSPFPQATSGGVAEPYAYDSRFTSLTLPHSPNRSTARRPYLTDSTFQPPTVPSQPVSSSTAYSTYPAQSQLQSSPSLRTSRSTADVRRLSPSQPTNPPLVRTSTIQGGASTMSGNGPGQSFNPYARYPANVKAQLVLQGSLEDMTQRWKPFEWEAKRRLVEFSRSQSGSVINAAFKAVTPEERTPNSICVSCIWWQEKQGCFVTSVDTIQLLESLIDVRFTVEEKNRIRRNLEGFRPQTVSKGKSDSEDFFKVIMSFPSPKPRNIEKDVKVFPWRILTHALKKIISKYSASYSSTAGALRPHPTLPSDVPHATGGADRTVSPQSASSSAASAHYTASGPPTALSPTLHGSGALGSAQTLSPHASADPYTYGGSAAGMPSLQTPTLSSSAWPRLRPTPGDASYYEAGAVENSTLTAAGRGSFDFAAYYDPEQPTLGGAEQPQQPPQQQIPQQTPQQQPESQHTVTNVASGYNPYGTYRHGHHTSRGA